VPPVPQARPRLLSSAPTWPLQRTPQAVQCFHLALHHGFLHFLHLAQSVAAAKNTAAPASASAGAKPVEEESSDNRYYDELLAILNKRK